MRYFLALLPPDAIQAQINCFKQQFADRYASRKAFNAPPHITIFPPFVWEEVQLSLLQTFLLEFARCHLPFEVQINGFAAFAPRVIYVHVERTSALLSFYVALQSALCECWNLVDPNSRHRDFKPHITVAFRDLTPANFQAGWAKFAHHPFTAAFDVQVLTLLQHNGQCWETLEQFPLRAID